MKRIPEANAKPAVVVTMWDLKNVETKRSNQYDSGAWIVRPAMATCTAMGTRRLGKTSMEIGEMTDHPTRCLVVPAPDRESLYFILGIDHEQVIDIKYVDGRARINLLKVFTLLGKHVAAGIREFYPIEWPDHSVSFEGKEYRALIMQLEKTSTKQVKLAKSKKRARKSLTPVLHTAASEQSN